MFDTNRSAGLPNQNQPPNDGDVQPPNRPYVDAEKPEDIADCLFKLGAYPFHDQHDRDMIYLPTQSPSDHYECLLIGSRKSISRIDELLRIRAIVRGRLTHAKLREAEEHLKLHALRGPRHELSTRFACVEDTIHIDLGDPGWNEITVDQNGWQIRPQTEPLFDRPQHMREMVRPARNGDPMELFRHFQVRSEHEEILVLAWIASAMHPVIPSPALLLVGPQGSAKSTYSRYIRSLVDPSVTPLLGDSDIRLLNQIFQHHAVPCFENVADFIRAKADAICRAVTGVGSEQRALYTDSGSVIRSYQRPIIINGLSVPSSRPDFLERCLVLDCQRIESFKPISELNKHFQEAAPRILGGLLDLLVKTMSVLEAAPKPTEFRMADFAWFGRAVVTALGKDHGDFDDAYRSNRNRLNQDIIEDQPLVNLVRVFAKNYSIEKPWEGTITELHKQLKNVAKREGISLSGRDLPGSGRWMSCQLQELSPPLLEDGVQVKQLPRTNTQRPWRICKVATTSEIDQTQIRERLEKKSDDSTTA